MSLKQNYSRKLLEVAKQFNHTKYEFLVDNIRKCYCNEDYLGMDKLVAKLPTNEQLLEMLVSKLKGKSVYTNLQKIVKKEEIVLEKQKIALSSLLTHIYIEAVKSPEYKVLEEDVLKKLNELKYK